MSTQVLKLVETDSVFLEATAHKVNIGDEEWFYQPFWYKKLKNGMFIQYRFDEIPKYVLTELEKQNPITTRTEQDKRGKIKKVVAVISEE